MQSKFTFVLFLALSFICGLALGVVGFSDYDVLSTYHNKAVRLKSDVALKNTEGTSLVLPKGTVLFYKNSYQEEDYLLLKIVAKDIQSMSSPADDKKENFIYFLQKQVK